MARLDPHSYADDAQPRADFLDWHARVDVPARTLFAEARLHLREPTGQDEVLDLDTRDLRIEAVTEQNGGSLRFELAEPEPILGARLRVDLPARTSVVQVRYRTSPSATALQWLDGTQTAGGRPFLYTQCQPIHARSVIPVQDTPRTRLRFQATLDVPADSTALMAAEALDRTVQGERQVARFRMQEPIAPYLFALALGALEARDIGPRTRVWAETPVVERAAWEFADTERLLAAGEALFGPYDWGRYDLLVLPAAFPYGGMENPRLTFLTPTVLAGDRSLVAVVAHELAHSWTGNLISNASAEHFWLNEGWTTYAERRIVEAVWGAETAELDWALGRRELDAAIRRFADQGRLEFSRLRTHLAGVDPDDAFSIVPYEKGALLLRAMERAAGRQAFDGFMRAYIAQFRFGALTTEDFVAFARQRLPAFDVQPWLDAPGVPDHAPVAHSARLQAIELLGGRAPSDEQAARWNATEWQLFVESLPRDAAPDELAELDRRFNLTASANYDLLEKWLSLAIRAGYTPAMPRVEQVLASVGRMKYLRPLYEALAARDGTRQRARQLFEANAARYHPIARHVVATILLA